MEINIPMKTKPPMKLDGVVSEAGREMARPALTLGNIRQGSNLCSAGRSGARVGSSAQEASSAGAVRSSGAVPGRGVSSGQVQTPQYSQTVRHYDIQPQGGKLLNKGGKVSLSPMLSGRGNSVVVCMGWDVDMRLGYDLDASCFMLGENGKVIGDDWFVFYNQPVSPDGAIRHGGERSTGNQEKILVDLARLSLKVKRLAFVLTIDEAKKSRKSFSQVANAHVRILDSTGKRELALFNLNDYEPGITAATVCEIYRYNGEWKINPMGNGLKDTGLLELCHFYGVSVEE